MNWKFNYWTILFILASGAFLYLYFTCYVADTVTPSGIKKVFPVNGTSAGVDTIPRDSAVQRIAAHAFYMDNLITEANKNAGFEIGVSNGIVEYIHLPRGELNEMLAFYPDGDVYVYPTVEINPENPDTSIISIVMSDTVYNKDGKHQFIGTFFDFGNPCPPTCKD